MGPRRSRPCTGSGSRSAPAPLTAAVWMRRFEEKVVEHHRVALEATVCAAVLVADRRAWPGRAEPQQRPTRRRTAWAHSDVGEGRSAMSEIASARRSARQERRFTRTCSASGSRWFTQAGGSRRSRPASVASGRDAVGSGLKHAGERVTTAAETVGSGVHEASERVALAADRVSAASEDLGDQLHHAARRTRHKAHRTSRRVRRQAKKLEHRAPVSTRSLRRGSAVVGLAAVSAGVARVVARQRKRGSR